MRENKVTYAAKPFIENRVLLAWSGIAMVVVPIVFNLVRDHLAPTTVIGGVIFLLAYYVMFQTVLIAMGMTVSALMRSYRLREIGWTWAIALTLFIGAYLYGIVVAVKRSRIDQAR